MLGFGMGSRIEVIGLKLPLLKEKCDLAEEIVKAAARSNVEILDDDIIVVTDKIVSKSFGKVVRVENVEVSERALKLAKRTGLDPRFVELVLRCSDDVVATVPLKKLVEKGLVELRPLMGDHEAAEKLLNEYPVFFVARREGSLWSDGGVDSSNLPPGCYAMPVENHDEAARAIREGVRRLTGKRVAVVICDTEIFLGGSIDVARGSYGIDPVDRCFACRDLYGKPKYGGVDLVVHEICSAAALVFKQAAEATPVAIVRGVKYRVCECGYREAVPRVNLPKVIKEVLRESVRVLGLKVLYSFLRTII
jgi:coenzyme F420-0:L-glutamate ligase/coenzyme F420-1:gamma-L-glutamate ligase